MLIIDRCIGHDVPVLSVRERLRGQLSILFLMSGNFGSDVAVLLGLRFSKVRAIDRPVRVQ